MITRQHVISILKSDGTFESHEEAKRLEESHRTKLEAAKAMENNKLTSLCECVTDKKTRDDKIQMLLRIEKSRKL